MINTNLDPTPITLEEIESTTIETDENTEMEKEDTDLKGSKISEEQSLLMSGTPCGPNCDSELFLLWKAISVQAASIGRSLLENSEP